MGGPITILAVGKHQRIVVTLSVKDLTVFEPGLAIGDLFAHNFHVHMPVVQAQVSGYVISKGILTAGLLARHYSIGFSHPTSLRAPLLVYFSDRHGEDQLGSTRIGVGVWNICFCHCGASRRDD
ncbi:hypothetical protein PS687_02508 [Pseudomonas fluorescens]|nr:hypothetical protein PS687_02508 [Pseudomonas fluorescens]